MKPNNKKIKPTRSGAVIDIMCEQWEIGEPFDISIRQQWPPNISSLPSDAIIFPDGFRTVKTIVEHPLFANPREESLC
jgi:hypothetical protein